MNYKKVQSFNSKRYNSKGMWRLCKQIRYTCFNSKRYNSKPLHSKKLLFLLHVSIPRGTIQRNNHTCLETLSQSFNSKRYNSKTNPIIHQAELHCFNSKRYNSKSMIFNILLCLFMFQFQEVQFKGLSKSLASILNVVSIPRGTIQRSAPSLLLIFVPSFNSKRYNSKNN